MKKTLKIFLFFISMSSLSLIAKEVNVDSQKNLKLITAGLLAGVIDAKFRSNCEGSTVDDLLLSEMCIQDLNLAYSEIKNLFDNCGAGILDQEVCDVFNPTYRHISNLLSKQERDFF